MKLVICYCWYTYVPPTIFLDSTYKVKIKIFVYSYLPSPHHHWMLKRKPHSSFNRFNHTGRHLNQPWQSLPPSSHLRQRRVTLMSAFCCSMNATQEQASALSVKPRLGRVLYTPVTLQHSISAVPALHPAHNTPGIRLQRTHWSKAMHNNTSQQ